MSKSTGRAFTSQRLRRAYGLRLVKEPLLAAVRVSHRTTIAVPADVFTLMQPFALQETAETLWALALNTQHQCEAPVAITRGLLNQSLVHPREVFRAMIAANAASVILSHNHPSGDPSPSQDDIQITRQIVAAGKIIGIPVVDHVIIGDRYVSFAEMGFPF